MSIDIPTFVGTIIAIIGGTKVIYELMQGSRTSAREEYKFARDFFDDREKNKEMHQYVKEKGLRAIAGNKKLPIFTIEYLLELTNPERALREFIFCRGYLEDITKEHKIEIKFQEKYKSKAKRKWLLILYFSLYFILAFMALSPLSFGIEYLHSKGALLLSFIVMMSLFGPSAILCLKEAASLYRAEKFIEKHTNQSSQHDD